MTHYALVVKRPAPAGSVLTERPPRNFTTADGDQWRGEGGATVVLTSSACPPHHPTCLCPHASSLNNFAAAAAAALWRWHLVAYFLSWPFISCHFPPPFLSFSLFLSIFFLLPGASRVASAKRDGRWLEVTDTRRQ